MLIGVRKDLCILNSFDHHFMIVLIAVVHQITGEMLHFCARTYDDCIVWVISAPFTYILIPKA